MKPEHEASRPVLAAPRSLAHARQMPLAFFGPAPTSPAPRTLARPAALRPGAAAAPAPLEAPGT
jgi:hypothetical protein